MRNEKNNQKTFLQSRKSCLSLADKKKDYFEKGEHKKHEAIIKRFVFKFGNKRIVFYNETDAKIYKRIIDREGIKYKLEEE